MSLTTILRDMVNGRIDVYLRVPLAEECVRFYTETLGDFRNAHEALGEGGRVRLRTLLTPAARDVLDWVLRLGVKRIDASVLGGSQGGGFPYAAINLRASDDGLVWGTSYGSGQLVLRDGILVDDRTSPKETLFCCLPENVWRTDGPPDAEEHVLIAPEKRGAPARLGFYTPGARWAPVPT